MGDLVEREHLAPKVGWYIKPATSPKRCEIEPGYYDGLIGVAYALSIGTKINDLG